MKCKGLQGHSLYGTIALIGLLLACYSEFLVWRGINGEPWQVVVAFALGGLYAALIILISEDRMQCPRIAYPYFVVQCLLLTVLLFVSPVRGFFALIVLPVASQSIEVGRRTAVVVNVYLYALTVAVPWYYYGSKTLLSSALAYFAAFAFGTGFTVLRVQAVNARRRAEALRADLELANEQLRQQAARMEELATVRERNRLAREIHDGVGHYLTVIKVQLDGAAALAPTDPQKSATAVAKAARLAGEALEDVRRSVRALAGESARPLALSLEELAAEGAPRAAVHVRGTPRELPHAIEHALFRVAQEGMTNVRKHARATCASVVLEYEPRRVVLTVTDNGAGAGAEAASEGGFGLRGIAERLALLGGRMEAGACPEGGFRLRAEVVT